MGATINVKPHFSERSNLEEVVRIIGGSPNIIACVVSNLPMPPLGDTKGVEIIVSTRLDRDVVELFGADNKLLGNMFISVCGKALVKLKAPVIEWREDAKI